MYHSLYNIRVTTQFLFVVTYGNVLHFCALIFFCSTKNHVKRHSNTYIQRKLFNTKTLNMKNQSKINDTTVLTKYYVRYSITFNVKFF